MKDVRITHDNSIPKSKLCVSTRVNINFSILLLARLEQSLSLNGESREFLEPLWLLYDK